MLQLRRLLSNAPRRQNAYYQRCQQQSSISAAPQQRPIERLLIANRGEIACRVMRTARRLGIDTVAVFSDADRLSKHVSSADVAYHIGGAAASDSYLDMDKIVRVAQQSGAQAIHPGYGFLSENERFARRCADAGIIFVGPPVDSIRSMGLKDASKRIVAAAGVPVVPGYNGESQEVADLRAEADRIGYPLMIKAIRGGGGKGMRIVERASDFDAQLESARTEAMKSFGDDQVLLERYVERPRHVEVQVFGDQHGRYVYLFERDCSVQRRHQKIIEEAPAPLIDAALRRQLGEAAVEVARAVDYVGAGTVEFILDSRDPTQFFFMEMNTRLQVEHPVTEMITGTDLVEWQLRVAAGLPLPKTQEELQLSGHAFEARIYAEDPSRGFLPSPGDLVYLDDRNLEDAFGAGTVRVESGVRQGDTISVFYDPMIAKLVVWGADRAQALQRMRRVLVNYHVGGVRTNTDFLRRLCAHEAFARGEVHTDFIPDFEHELFAKRTPDGEQVAKAALSTLIMSAESSRVEALMTTLGTDPTSAALDRPFFRSAMPHVERVVLLDDDGESVAVELTAEHGSSGTSWSIRVAGSGREFHFSELAIEPEASGSGATAFSANVDGVLRRWRSIHSPEGGVDIYDSVQGSCSLQREVVDFGSADGAAAGGGGGNEALAPMPGVVEKVMVEAGQRVRTGDTLIVMIAMKMEYTVQAPCDGVVEQLFAQRGASVNKGDVLVRVDPE